MLTGPRSLSLSGELRRIALTAIACFVALLGCLGAAPAGDDLASVARGGRLYDDWAKELGSAALRAAERSRDAGSIRPGRCVDCHGWDYLGKDGSSGRNGPRTLVKGIDAMTGASLQTVKRSLTTKIHGYGEFLKTADIDDLARFVAQGQVRMDPLIDPATSRAKGDAGAGIVFFQTICANCHGNDGQQILEAEPIGDMARANPWRALHTLLNGHPNGNMPALRALDISSLVNMLAYIQTLPKRNLLASIVRGGRLYDTWYKENGHEVPAGVHPSFPPSLTRGLTRASEQRATWRCKECHGWDYRGREGGSGQPAIAGINKMMGADPKDIIAHLRDNTHRFSGLLSERDVWDLAHFISQGLVDMDTYIDRETKKARGDGAQYAAHYQTICAPCHGLSGRDVRTMPPLGRIATNEPWRALHGIFNGHPGEAMPPLSALPRDVAVGILAYIQTLPIQR